MLCVSGRPTLDHTESILTYHSGILGGIHLTCPQSCICRDFPYHSPLAPPLAERARSPGECIVEHDAPKIKLYRRETAMEPSSEKRLHRVRGCNEFAEGTPFAYTIIPSVRCTSQHRQAQSLRPAGYELQSYIGFLNNKNGTPRGAVSVAGTGFACPDQRQGTSDLQVMSPTNCLCSPGKAVEVDTHRVTSVLRQDTLVRGRIRMIPMPSASAWITLFVVLPNRNSLSTSWLSLFMCIT
jgi:hypothetical protein